MSGKTALIFFCPPPSLSPSSQPDTFAKLLFWDVLRNWADLLFGMQKLQCSNQSGYGINKCREPVKPSVVDNSGETEPSLITIFLGPKHRKAGQMCSICCQFWGTKSCISWHFGRPNCRLGFSGGYGVEFLSGCASHFSRLLAKGVSKGKDFWYEYGIEFMFLRPHLP